MGTKRWEHQKWTPVFRAPLAHTRLLHRVLTVPSALQGTPITQAGLLGVPLVQRGCTLRTRHRLRAAHAPKARTAIQRLHPNAHNVPKALSEQKPERLPAINVWREATLIRQEGPHAFYAPLAHTRLLHRVLTVPSALQGTPITQAGLLGVPLVQRGCMLGTRHRLRAARAPKARTAIQRLHPNAHNVPKALSEQKKERLPAINARREATLIRQEVPRAFYARQERIRHQGG
jgi:hypothetical protein